jgi:NADPH:quinone reductase-like Zn-dependent oxidoreductase
LTSTERRADLLVLKELIESGQVTPAVSRTYPLAETARAMTDADEGHGRGKTVVSV